MKTQSLRYNRMILAQCNFPFNMRFCIRNQWSAFLNDFSIILIGKHKFIERTEYKFGLIGFVFVLLVFNQQKQNP